MLASMSDSRVELPQDVRHYKTTAFAESWNAYEALTAEDGWTAEAWFVDENQSRCEPDDAEARKLHEQKTAKIRGHVIVVFPPVAVDDGLVM